MPKGVILTHGNVIAAVIGAAKVLTREITITHDDIYLSYLPLAHILAFVIHFAAFWLGARAGFGVRDKAALCG